MRDDDATYTTINTRNNSTTLAITGLQAYTNYEFKLRAVNIIGVGPYSSPVGSRTFEAGEMNLFLFTTYMYVMFVVALNCKLTLGFLKRRIIKNDKLYVPVRGFYS